MFYVHNVSNMCSCNLPSDLRFNVSLQKHVCLHKITDMHVDLPASGGGGNDSLGQQLQITCLVDAICTMQSQVLLPGC